MRGLEYQHQIEITVDGARVHLAAFGGDEDFKASLKNPTLAGDDVEARARVRVPLKAGPHTIGVAFIEKPAAQNSWRLQPFLRSSHDTFDPTGYPHIESSRSPARTTRPDPATRRAAARSSCAVRRRPPKKNPARAGSCRRSLVWRIAARRADEDLQRLMAFYATGRREGDFERGIQLALQRMLASAKFALRIERDPAGAAPGLGVSAQQISIWRRGSRSSSGAASRTTSCCASPSRAGCARPRSLRQQLRRMLADPKSEALVTNFAGQWLYLRNLKNMVPLSTEFVDFDDNLRRAFERETELFFESVMRENRSVLDLMTADYTFVNERLAKHYRFPASTAVTSAA